MSALVASLLAGCAFHPSPQSGALLSWTDWDWRDEPDDPEPSSAPSSGVCYSLTPVGSYGRSSGLADLGAVTWVVGDRFWAASDTGGRVCELNLTVDKMTGEVRDCGYGRVMSLDGRVDVEGLAFDPLTQMLWASDEAGGTITGHRLSDGKQLAEVDVPSCYRRCRPNLSLESLTIRDDGQEMWTCNETTLEGDGAVSTKTTTSLVRLTRFVRADCVSPWRAAGQWAYPVGRMHGGSFRGIQLRGVSDLCVLPDGTLLTLEREFSWNVMPCFRCRIYQVDFTGATDVSARESLTDEDIVPVSLRRLWSDDTTFCNYEGMSLGKRLVDGSRVLLLVSDGDDHARERIMSFRLYGK